MSNVTFKHLSPKETNAIEEFVVKLRGELGDNLIDIKFFGSKLRGDFNDESDIDVLIILKSKTVEVEKKIAKIWIENELKYFAGISYVIFSEHQYKMNLTLNSPFIERIIKEGISI